MPNIDLKTFTVEQGAPLPPVHTWQPDFCGDMDMLIRSNGDWIHEGQKIQRPAMVKMFSRILWHEKNEHFLVTPVEKVRIQVEDAPFLITSWENVESEEGRVIVFTSMTGDVCVLGVDCDLWLGDFESEERPYINMRYGMKGLIGRNVFYDLANHLVPVNTAEGCGMGLISGAKQYLLVSDS